ncbi:MAG: CehA/McbA family metallohydrolase [Planctomycetota bacterium]
MRPLVRPQAMRALLIVIVGAGGITLGAVALRAWWAPRAPRPSLGDDSAVQDEGEKALAFVPPLRCRPSSFDGLGTATLDPPDPVPAGSIGSWTIAYTAAEPGIAPGGFVLLQVSPWWGWTPPQTQKPAWPGYTTVTVSGKQVATTVETLELHRVLVRLPEGLAARDTLTFRYGNARADRFAEAAELFQILVDGDGDGHYAEIDSSPTLRVLAREPAFLIVNLRPQAHPGETVQITVAAVDALGNWSRLPAGEYRLAFTRDGEPSGQVTVDLAAEQELLRAPWSPSQEGLYFCEVSGPAELRGKSNVLWCQGRERMLSVFFGDIHGHSRLSDGTGTPADYYRYARDVSGLDIASLTDHDAFGTIPLEGRPWQRIAQAANNAYEPGRFVTLLGFEWTNWQSGHRNVYYRDGTGPFLRSIDEPSDTPGELWRQLEPFEAMTIPHHPGGGPIPIDWSIPPGPNEPLVEICSIHGCSETIHSPLRIHAPVENGFVDKALERGYRLGFIGSGDTHDGHPGQRSAQAVCGGLLAVFAEELTREAIWAALKRRHTYATSGPKIVLFTQVAHSRMGSETTWSREQGPIPIAISVAACGDIRHVEIVRDGKTIDAVPGNGPFLQLLVEDPEIRANTTTYYYARVTQEDGAMAWSSPVWVTIE